MTLIAPNVPRSGNAAVDRALVHIERVLKDWYRQLPVSVSASPKVGPRSEIHFENAGNMTITVTDDPTNDRINIALASSGGGGGLSPGDYGDITVGVGPTMTIDPSAVTGGKIANGAVTTAKISADNVTNTELADMADATVKGRAVGAGAGDPTDLSAAQVAAIAIAGGVPASAGLSHAQVMSRMALGFR